MRRLWWDHTEQCPREVRLGRAFDYYAVGCTCRGTSPPRDTFDDMPDDPEAFRNERAERNTWR
jgi:hypothetical protein